LTAPARPRPAQRLNLGLTAAACTVFVAAMVGASFAAVPLYRMFCELTGFDGTPRRATGAPALVSDRVVTVQFDANIGNGLGWSFRPATRSMKVKLGEVGQVAYLAENRTPWTVTGTAVFNVTPEAAGAYFNKIECFCFNEQTLAAGERAELGVSFFVDPAYANDGDLDTLSTITLSYTFFPVPEAAAKPLAAADVRPPTPAL
jgi:cytochrome c oxidase assembly protein subunit 11